MHAATRGPNPLSRANSAVGDSPGPLVIDVREDGREAAVRGHVSVSDVVGGREFADPHGLAVHRTA